MAKLENSLMNMVLSLTVITVVVGALLGAVNMVTEGPIQDAAKAKQQNAITAVVPVEGATPGEAREVTSANGMPALIFPVTKDGQLVGNAVQAISKNGFGGNITVMIGFDAEGNILGYSVLDCSNETPGLGAKMPDWFQKGAKGDVIGKNPGKDNMTVKKDGGDVDAITAATISSRAFCDAIAQAYGVMSGADVVTSATAQAKEECVADSCAACCGDSVQACCCDSAKCEENK